MEDEVIHLKYRELACAIIHQAVSDYLEDKSENADYKLYSWIMGCNLFEHLDIDKEYFYIKALHLKENKKKLKGIHNYGKKEER